MKIIIEGCDREVAKVIQENKYRVLRGVIKFTPAGPEITGEILADTKAPDIADTKEAEITDTKSPVKKTKK